MERGGIAVNCKLLLGRNPSGFMPQANLRELGTSNGLSAQLFATVQRFSRATARGFALAFIEGVDGGAHTISALYIELT